MQVMQLSKMAIWKEKPDTKAENTDSNHVIDQDRRTITDDRQDQVHDHRIDLPIEMVENTLNVIHVETANNQDSVFL